MRLRKRLTALVAPAVLVMSVVPAASAALAPFAENFQDGAADGFVTGSVTNTGGTLTTNAWSVVERPAANSGDFRYNHVLTGQNISGFSSIDLTNIPNTPGSSFTVSTQLTVNALPGGTTNAGTGIRFLATSNATNSDSYIADISKDGTVRIVEFTGGTANTSFSTTTGTGSVVAGNTYNLLLTGTYNAAGALSLVFNVTGDNFNKTASNATPDTTPRTGQFYGFRDNVGGGTAGTLNVDFDNFAVTAAVPEPATAAMFALGAIALAGRRRRK